MKTGLTLIEIIISIGLIVVIGTISIFSFNLIKKKEREKTLNSMSSEILTALKLYIETNDEIKKNIYEEYEGMVITLNTLEKEGLLDFQNIDVSDNKDYVVAFLSQDSGCSSITTIESWDLTNGPLSICLKSESSSNNKTIKEELIGDDGYYIAKGANPNNWVEFNVESDSSLLSYFPNNEDEDLWRIMSINDNGNIKLIYSQDVLSNNSFLEFYSGTKLQYNNKEYYCSGQQPATCERVETENGWQISDILSDVTEEGNSKKDKLYQKIVNNGWIVPFNYIFHKYHYASSYLTGSSALSEGPTIEKKEYTIGTLTSYNEYKDTLVMGESWLMAENEKYPILATNHTEGSSHIHLYLSQLGVNLNYLIYREKGYVEYRYYAWQYFYEYPTYNYKPTIVLNKNVELESSTCNNEEQVGSKECPYKLVCNNC